MKYVLPTKIWFVKTSTRIVKYSTRVVKSNPVLTRPFLFQMKPVPNNKRCFCLEIKKIDIVLLMY